MLGLGVQINFQSTATTIVDLKRVEVGMIEFTEYTPTTFVQASWCSHD
jgi:hypothetical protein